MGIDKGAGKAAKGLKDKLAGAQKPAAADKHQLKAQRVKAAKLEADAGKTAKKAGLKSKGAPKG